MQTVLQKAKTFIYRNARPLDLARWRYHFENGSKEEVVQTLMCYQNIDGGFGHALEADSWNPLSSPIQTWAATEVLKEIDFDDRDHPIIDGIVHYLESTRQFDSHVWFNTIESNNRYPHASWWHMNRKEDNEYNYNPTACLAGFLFYFAVQGGGTQILACRIISEAVNAFLNSNGQDMHTILCYIRLAQYYERTGLSVENEFPGFISALRQKVSASITQDTAQWEAGYACRPSQYFCTKSDPLYQDNRIMADYECSFIKSTQQQDGSWVVPWCWESYPEQWAVSKNWWKSHIIIKNLLYLKGVDPDWRKI
ncbi:MAG TPA: hypothetical protein IAA58_00950 [Candidatus Gallacutalibacter stercoravium]|nr:hypothetical protein [Candidatus Gallacutalibacter stercoravium]